MEYNDFLIRILIALTLSFVIGLERQWRRRSAGMRTSVLVCLGAFLFVSMPVMLNSDDLKVAAQVVSGIGFLGAGVILKDGHNIRGLNTAATLWCDAAIGVLCATGLLLEAVTGTVLILLANIVLRYITRKVMTLSESKCVKHYELTVVVSKGKEILLRTMLIQIIGETDIVLNSMKTKELDEKKAEIKAEVKLDSKHSSELELIISRFTMEQDVSYVGYLETDDDDET